MILTFLSWTSDLIFGYDPDFVYKSFLSDFKIRNNKSLNKTFCITQFVGGYDPDVCFMKKRFVFGYDRDNFYKRFLWIIEQITFLKTTFVVGYDLDFSFLNKRFIFGYDSDFVYKTFLWDFRIWNNSSLNKTFSITNDLWVGLILTFVSWRNDLSLGMIGTIFTNVSCE